MTDPVIEFFQWLIANGKLSGFIFFMVLISLHIVAICWILSGGLHPVHGGNQTNSTAEMLYGDNWGCGYINTTTTLEDIRDCYRD